MGKAAALPCLAHTAIRLAARLQLPVRKPAFPTTGRTLHFWAGEFYTDAGHDINQKSNMEIKRSGSQRPGKGPAASLLPQ
jgi:hypothetical protein